MQTGKYNADLVKQDIKEKTLLLCDGSGENKSHNFIKKCKEYGIKL